MCILLYVVMKTMYPLFIYYTPLGEENQGIFQKTLIVKIFYLYYDRESDIYTVERGEEYYVNRII